MTTLKNILVGVDFSEASRAALKRAGHLARAWGAPLAVAHVIKDQPYETALPIGDFLKFSGEMETELSQKLGDFVRETLGEEMLVETEVRLGVPDRDLIEEAVDREAGLILVGGQGKSAVARFFVGSVAESLAAYSPIPLWLERGPLSAVDSVLLPTDFSPRSRQGVSVGLEWARRLSVPVVLLHVAESRYIPSLSMVDPKDYETKMKGVAEKHFEAFLSDLPLQGLKFSRELKSGNPTEEIEKYQREHSGALLILSTRGGSAPAARPLGSVTNQILRHAPGPTLLIPTHHA